MSFVGVTETQASLHVGEINVHFPVLELEIREMSKPKQSSGCAGKASNLGSFSGIGNLWPTGENLPHTCIS